MMLNDLSELVKKFSGKEYSILVDFRGSTILRCTVTKIGSGETVYAYYAGEDVEGEKKS